jgi:hypothetical protein
MMPLREVLVLSHRVISTMQAAMLARATISRVWPSPRSRPQGAKNPAPGLLLYRGKVHAELAAKVALDKVLSLFADLARLGAYRRVLSSERCLAGRSRARAADQGALKVRQIQ